MPSDARQGAALSSSSQSCFEAGGQHGSAAAHWVLDAVAHQWWSVQREEQWQVITEQSEKLVRHRKGATKNIFTCPCFHEDKIDAAAHGTIDR
jgi:hypothetical protein